MTTKSPRNTAYDVYKEPDDQLRHMSQRGLSFSNRVIPGSTAGGVVLGINPHDVKHMEVVIDPHMRGIDEKPQILNLGRVSKEEMDAARKIALQTVTGDDDIDLRRNQASSTLAMILKAQDMVQNNQAVAEPASSPTDRPTPAVEQVGVVFDIPGFGTIPVRYDSVAIDAGTMVVAVRESLAGSTFFPSPSLQSAISVVVGEKTYVAHTTPVKYNMQGLTCALLMLESE
jgi:hypothetical protein